MKLKGKVAMVTGGGTGIGKSVAIALAVEGAKVVVLGRRLEPLQETVREIVEAGGEALAVSTDITKIDQINNALQQVKETWGRLDVLVNNAGAGLRKSFLEISLEELDTLYNVDLRGVFAVTQVMVPLLKEAGGGSIINIASILGVTGSPNFTSYCAMKGGVVNLSRALAAELGPEIRVNCLCPAHIVTPMTQSKHDRWVATGKADALIRRFPAKRIGSVEDMNGSVIFFASDDSLWITGQVVTIDGGLNCYI